MKSLLIVIDFSAFIKCKNDKINKLKKRQKNVQLFTCKKLNPKKVTKKCQKNYIKQFINKI